MKPRFGFPWRRCVLAWHVALLCGSLAAQAGQPQGARRDYFAGIGGGAVADLTNSAAFQNNQPSWTDILGTAFVTETNRDDNYGQRLRAWVLPPMTGNYIFWIASDDNSVLYLSPNDQASAKKAIASVPGSTSPRVWGSYAQQKSTNIFLDSTSLYYLEALQKEGYGGDHLAVRWQLPDGSLEEPIPAARLVPYFEPAALRIVGGTNAVNTETVVSVRVQTDGRENSLGFSLQFDTNVLQFVRAMPGSAALAGVANINTRLAAAGRVGFVLSLPAGQTFKVGASELLQVALLARVVTNTTVAFGDSPVLRDVSDALANSVPATYSNGVATITTMVLPSILTQPVGLSVRAGSNATLSVVADGSAPLRYQWRKDDAPLGGATNASLGFAPAATNDSGNYRVVVSNAGGSVTSVVAVLTVLPPLVAPAIAAPPLAWVASAGEVVKFTVGLTGSSPFKFQWRFNGNDLANQTNATLVLSNVTVAQSGRYSVRVANDMGSVTSPDAQLTVSATPRAVRVVNRSVATGGLIDVPVELAGLGDENAVGFSLVFDPARFAYVSYAAGSAAAGAMLYVNTNQAAAGRVGVALSKPGGQDFDAGAQPILLVRLLAGDVSGTNILGFGNVPVACELVDVFGQTRPVDFQPGLITILSSPPSIAEQPQSLTAPIFTSPSLSVGARGSVPLFYHWYANGAIIPGATNPVLTLPGITAAKAGDFQVVVSNAVDVVTSAVARVTVQRIVRLGPASGPTGTPIEVPVELLASGDENSLGFSLRFDPSRLTLRQVRAVDANATYYLNTNQAASGVLGLAVAKSLPLTFAQGTQQVAIVTFIATALPGAAGLAFQDVPVARELADANARPCPVLFQDGGVETMLRAPVVTRQPAAQDVSSGGNAAFDVSVAGSLPMSFQWQKNGIDIPQATNISLTLPNVALSAAGSYAVRLVNAAGTTNSLGAVLTVRPPPGDLFVTAFTVPATALAGDTLTVTWRTTNAGTASLTGFWQDSIYMAQDAQGTSARSLASFPAETALGAGQSLMRTGLVHIPSDATGVKYLGIMVDSGYNVAEVNEANNWFWSPTSTRILSPDLQVRLGAVVAQAYFGDTITVSWAVTNRGDATATANWSDRVFLSTSSNSVQGATPLLTVLAGANSPLAAQAGYTRTASVPLPLSLTLGPGQYFLVLATDAEGQQVESSETNNLAAAPIALNNPPLPDLAVANITVPAAALPGDRVTLSWAVTNIGRATANGAWSETVIVSNRFGGATVLATLAYTNQLEVGRAIARTQQVTLPPLLGAGSNWFLVRVDSRSEVVEDNEDNNTTCSTATMLVPAILKLDVPVTQLAEGAPAVQASLSHNGDRRQSLTITLLNSDATELDAPATLLIPAGQLTVDLAISAKLDNQVDGPHSVQLTASATGYTGASATVTVLDIDIPKLTLTLTATELLEGASMGATLTRELVTAQPLTVYLSRSGTSRLQVPEVVTIAANQAAASFTVQAQDNWTVEGPRLCTINAQATGYQNASAQLTLLDNDLPTVTLGLNTTNFSEGAGPQAAVATLARAPVTIEALYLELVSSDTNAARVPRFVAVPGGLTALNVPVAAVDNTETNAPRPVELDAYVLDAFTGERLSQSPAAWVRAMVTDDDGPTLRVVVTKKIVGEGLSPATTGTVTRNTGTNGSLGVSLASSDTTEATVPLSVTIPDGQNSATFAISSVADGVTDGSQVAVITASTKGYVSGSDTITVTDNDMPDITVTLLESPGTVETEAYTQVGYKFVNEGIAPTTGSVVLRTYLSHDEFLSGDDLLIEEYNYTGDLPLGVPIQRTASVRMPREAGLYWVIVQADGSGLAAPEMRLDNNVTAAAKPTSVVPAYAAQVWALDHTAPAGTPIRLAGRVFKPSTNEKVPYALATIHVMQGATNGSQRLLAALADEQGNFATSFVPVGNEAGLYFIGATHPGSADVAVQDQFRLLAIQTKPAWVQARVTEGSTLTGFITLSNPADVPLTGLSASVSSNSPNLGVTVGLSAVQIPGFDQISLTYQVHALDASLYQAFASVRVVCDQGVSADVPFYVTVDPLLPHLVATPAELSQGMKRGEQTVVAFEVVNLGGVETGPITVSMQPQAWLTLISTNPMPSLLPGAANTNRVMLLLSPAADSNLGEYKGSIALNCPGTSLGVPYNFRALSEARGDLLLIAEDEYTFHAQGSPHVTNATVIVRDVVTQGIVTNGVTDAQGQFFAGQLLENYYQIEVSADKHTSYRGVSLLTSGRTNEVHAFMPRQAVTYTWRVEPTEIEDRTKITIETTFETMVPMPVITVDPSLIDLDQYAAAGVGYLEMMVTNHGLVAGLDATIDFDAHELWEIKPLVPNLGTLSANSGMVVPVQIRKLTNAELSRCNIPCQINGRVSYSLLSGGNLYRYNVPILAVHAWGNCACPAPPSAPSCVSCGGGGGGWGGGGGGGGGGAIPVYSPPPVYEPPPQCVPNQGGVCAKVKLRLDQEAVISRDAFKATLELANSTPLNLTGVKVDLDIRNNDGALVTNLFGVYPPKLTGLSGVDGAGTVAANATGTAEWIIVPSVDAAPEKPVQYKVGGTLVYVDNGQVVTIDLAPTPITVYPLPQLKLDYFHERDVVADDPFTAPIEPSIPYNLAVLVQNTGKGDAHKMKIVSAQPKIIENLSGLLIDFKIIATEVAGQNMTPTLTADFGEILAGTTKVGRWLLTSTLQGQFTEYKATFQHMDDLGNPRLLIITNVAIHEMIHLVQAGGSFEDGMPDFLVNEVLNDPRDATDPYDLPDTVYLSDGRKFPVAVVLDSVVNGSVSAGSLSVELTVPAPEKGFVYVRVPDPGAGQYPLVRVVRSDGVEVAWGKNAWATDRTFRSPYERPIYEHNLHVFDYNSLGRYTLYYLAPQAPDMVAPVSHVLALPANSRPQINLQWEGTDTGGSGLAAYDVYASDNGGAFLTLPSLEKTTLTSTIFEGQSGHQYAFYSRATDRAGNRQAAPATPDASTFVNVSNQAPVLAEMAVQTINEGDALSYIVNASDPDLPLDQLTFDLKGQPAGMTLTKISATQARIQWNTGEADGPGTYNITVSVRDNLTPQLGDAKNLRVVVNENNTAPVLAPIAARKMNKGQWLVITNSAQDFDLPAQTLTFGLGQGAPSNMTIDAGGVLRWQPMADQAGKTNVIAVLVSDNGVPSLSATQWLTVAVRNIGPDFVVSAGRTNLFAGESGAVPLGTVCGLSLKQLDFVLLTDASRLTDWTLSNMRAGLGATLRPSGRDPNVFELSFSTGLGSEPIHGTFTLAQLGFRSVVTNSAGVLLTPDAAIGVTTEGVTNSHSGSVYGRVFVIADEPILEALAVTNEVRSVVLYGKPAYDYVLEAKSAVEVPGAWTPTQTIHLDGPFQVISWVPDVPATVYLRAYRKTQ